MRRRIRHASSTTRRAPDASLTGERQQPILSAVLAVKPQETPRENSTIQQGAEFFFMENRIKEPLVGLFADRTSAETMRATTRWP